jgi:ribosomal protein S21
VSEGRKDVERRRTGSTTRTPGSAWVMATSPDRLAGEPLRSLKRQSGEADGMAAVRRREKVATPTTGAGQAEVRRRGTLKSQERKSALDVIPSRRPSSIEIGS